MRKADLSAQDPRKAVLAKAASAESSVTSKTTEIAQGYCCISPLLKTPFSSNLEG